MCGRVREEGSLSRANGREKWPGGVVWLWNDRRLRMNGVAQTIDARQCRHRAPGGAEPSVAIAINYGATAVVWLGVSIWFLSWSRARGDWLSSLAFLDGIGFIVLTAAILQRRLCRLFEQLEVSRRELAVSEERLRVAVTAAGMVTWEIELVATNCPLLWSHGARAIFGREPEAYPEDREKYDAGILPGDRVLIDTALKRAIVEDLPFDCEYRLSHPDGTTHWHAAHGRVVRDNKGRPVRLTGVSMDCTDRKQATAAPAESDRILGPLTTPGSPEPAVRQAGGVPPPHPENGSCGKCPDEVKKAGL